MEAKTIEQKCALNAKQKDLLKAAQKAMQECVENNIGFFMFFDDYRGCQIRAANMGGKEAAPNEVFLSVSDEDNYVNKMELEYFCNCVDLCQDEDWVKIEVNL